MNEEVYKWLGSCLVPLDKSGFVNSQTALPELGASISILPLIPVLHCDLGPQFLRTGVTGGNSWL